MYGIGSGAVGLSPFYMPGTRTLPMCQKAAVDQGGSRQALCFFTVTFVTVPWRVPSIQVVFRALPALAGNGEI